jgi:hypothetical protein
MRCARCGGLTVLEEFKDFGLESCGNGFWGRRCVNCGAIVDLVIAAHQCVMLRTAVCHSIVIPTGSSLPLNLIEQRITKRS